MLSSRSKKCLERKLSALVNQDYTIVGGVDAIVEILNSVDRGTEKHIMETLEVEEPELADEIRKKMFVFEDILSLDDRAIQRVLRDVETMPIWHLHLKGANRRSTECNLKQPFKTSCCYDSAKIWTSWDLSV